MELHEYQRAILSKLVLKQPLRFNQLLIENIESEHMNYHLRKLVESGLVQKDKQNYFLTDKGKDLMNMFDDGFKAVEKQPKTSLILNVVRFNKKKGAIENLLNRRLRQPYYGKVGRPGGKIHFGEPLLEAAARELLEETNLVVKKFTLETIYRKVRSREDGTIVQDVIFYVFFANEVSGKLKEKSIFEENFWATKEEALKMDIYDDFRFTDRLEPMAEEFIEDVSIADGF